jgi:hypothetical protein
MSKSRFVGVTENISLLAGISSAADLLESAFPALSAFLREGPPNSPPPRVSAQLSRLLPVPAVKDLLPWADLHQSGDECQPFECLWPNGWFGPYAFLHRVARNRVR